MAHLRQSGKGRRFFLFLLIAYGLVTLPFLLASRSVAGSMSNAGLVTKAVAIATGADFSCALTDAGGVQCWGLNNYGQLGDGTTVNRNVAVPVQGLASNVKSIAVGHAHACALLNNGTVRCWGQNENAELGSGSSAAFSTTPVLLPALSNIVLLAAGGHHNCVVTSNGRTRCWGMNYNGQLGTGSGNPQANPVRVFGLDSTPTQLALGDQHSCAIVDSGVQCWGYNAFGQLGNDSRNDSSTPVDVKGIGPGVIALTAGRNHSCAITSGGGATCWGANYNLQLGNNSNTDSNTPVAVFGLNSGAQSISAFWEFTCTLMKQGAVKCWGKNDVGNLGDNSATGSSIPVDVSTLQSGVLAIATGESHSCAVLDDGGVKCWGGNSFGQRGDGQDDGQESPVTVEGLQRRTIHLSAGGNHTCSLSNRGTEQCWGRNTFGQLGDGGNNGRYQPQPVSGLDNEVAAISSGNNHTCALLNNGSAKCWGLNSSYQVGDGTNLTRLTPTTVNLNSVSIKAITSGRRHTCALTTGGAVKCWGSNSSGQLGDGTSNFRTAPVDVLGMNDGVTAVAAGGDFTCALRQDHLYCWGANESGQLGTGTFDAAYAPQTVSGIEGTPIQVSAGWSHTCAITNQGALYCWGQNDHGELGNATVGPRPSPIIVNDVRSGAGAVAAGLEYTCAIVNGGAKCWGNNSSGQLGDGTAVNRNAPTDVLGLQSDVSEITAGAYHACALTSDGTVKCWGFDDFGQLGINPGWIPDDVLGFGTIPPPTDVPTPSPTNTPSKTPTATKEPTSTGTSTPTPSATATGSSTPTFTPTESPTPTTTDQTEFIVRLPLIAKELPPVDTPTPTATEQTAFIVRLPLISKEIPPTATATPIPTATLFPASWRRLSNSPDNVDTLAFNSSGQLLIGVRNSSAALNGIYRALDCSDFATFQQQIPTLNMRDLAFSGSSGLAATSGSKVYYSNDGGLNWTPTGSTMNEFVFSVLFASPSQAYAATDNKLYASQDSGQSWNLVYPGDPSRLNKLYFDPASGTLWIGSYDKGLWKLLPGSNTPLEANLGFSSATLRITDIASKNGLLYIATTDGIYRGDGNAAWSAFGLQGEYVLSLEATHSFLYAGLKEQGTDGLTGRGKGIWLRPLDGSFGWAQDAGYAQTAEVYDLLNDNTNGCNALLAATVQGVWAYR
ncbi:MAG: hypothetical protein U0175_26075 [Caldilineaceae bacterium]